MIRTRQLTRRFGRRTAVDHVDLDIDGPGVVGLLGPNGAGKTTLMRLVTGYLAMSEGTASVQGHDVFEAPLKVKASVGYLPERPPLDPELTVGDYLRFVARLRGVPAAQRLDAVGRALERTRLTHRERDRIATLSKGYRQRVGIAQAVVHDPPVLILDEPTSGLDPAQLVPLRELVRQLGADRLVWLSSHVLAEVEELCGRVVVLHEGRVVGDGSPRELARAAGLSAWVELVVDESGVDHRASLAEVAGVTAVERLSPGRYRLEGSGFEASVAERAAPWGMRQLTPRVPGLAEAFLALVGSR